MTDPTTEALAARLFEAGKLALYGTDAPDLTKWEDWKASEDGKEYRAVAAEARAYFAEEITKWRDAEHATSDAYIRLRNLTPGAHNTPYGPSPEQVWTQTEESLKALTAEVEELRRLKEAVNQSSDDCAPECSVAGHVASCPSTNTAQWLITLQAEVERLKGNNRRLQDAESEYQSEVKGREVWRNRCLQAEAALAHVREGLLPTTWLDPLLSGDKKVLGPPPWNCPDIERLFKALHNRILALLGPEGK